MNLLIIGDPKGTHSMCALKKYVPENIWVWENDPRHIYTINQINDRINVTQDLQELVNKNMKFDVVIGNPPYSDRSGNTSKSKDLDDKFTLISTQIADKVKLIVRSKHFTNSKSSFRQKLFASGHLVSIVRLPDNTFPVIQNTETCVITWDVNHSGPTSITYKDGTVVNRVLTKDTVIKLDNPDFVESVENNLSDRWIRGKLNRNKIIAGDSPMVEICGTGDTPVVTYIAQGLEKTAANSYGVVINVAAEWGSLGKVLLKPYEASISSSVMCLTTNTQEEAIQLQNYLLSDEVKKLVKSNMPSFHPTKDLFKKIPSPFN
jgi:Eco57I restriction-modification methylase